MFQKARTFFFIGVWVALLPFLGFPKSWKNLFFLATGIIISYLAYRLNKEMIHMHKKEKHPHKPEVSSSFMENKGDIVES